MARKLGKDEVAAIMAGRNFQHGVKGFDRHDKPKVDIGRGMSSLGEPFTVKELKEQRRIKQEALFNAQLSGKRTVTGKKL